MRVSTIEGETPDKSGPGQGARSDRHSGPGPRNDGQDVVARIARRLWWLRYWIKDYVALVTGGIPSHTIRLFVYRRILSIRIGSDSSVHRRCRFYNPEHVAIGHNTIINNDVLLDGRCGLSIGNNVSVSEGTMVLTLAHDIDSPDFAAVGHAVRIEDYVFIGARALVLPGVTLGEGAVVGAGSVVTRNVDPYVVVAGAPARPVRTRNRDLRYRLNHRKLLG